MQDFSDNQNLIDLVTNLSKHFDGKDKTELISAIFKEAKKNKQQGSLTNDDIDNFSQIISPFLDEKQRHILNKLVKELKKI